MKVANNMDSVFDTTAKNLLDFDLMFDEDDTLIDIVAGVKENGTWVTGPNPESLYEFAYPDDIDSMEEGQVGPTDTLTDKCDTGRREGLKDTQAAPEGSTKNADQKFYDGNEGMDKAVPGTGSSAESRSHEDDEKDAEVALTKESIAYWTEEEDPLTDKDDEDVRDGKVKYASSNVEGEKQDVIGAALESDEICSECGLPVNECTCGKSVKEALAYWDDIDEAFDPSRYTDDTFDKWLKDDSDIIDKEDEKLRSAKVKYASSNIEGKRQKVLGAALESDNIDDELFDPTTIPDDVQDDGASNVIVPDAELQSDPGIEPADEYYEWGLDEGISASDLAGFGESSDTDDEEEDDDESVENALEGYEWGLDEGISASDLAGFGFNNDPVVYTGWRHVTEADIPVDSEDDADIEAVNNGDFETDSTLNLDVDYDDDALIDMAINGEDF